MPEGEFPTPVAEVVATLADLFRHQDRKEIVELLESAQAWFDNTGYDNWNGGTYTYALRLEVPISVFASIEPRLAQVEKEISEKLVYFSRTLPNDSLGEATVSPITAGKPQVGQRFAPSEIEVRRLWPQNRFRLFLSHISKYKVPVSRLRDELELRGVAAFVAHQAIKPSLEWQHEIELALRSMHALAALITPGFHESLWTDQEIGWALGRGVTVIPVRLLKKDPYGFIAKVQGVTGTLNNSADLAAAVVNSLLANSQTHGEMRRAMVLRLCQAKSFFPSLAIRDHIPEADDYTQEEKAALWKACNDNDQVYNANKVADVIYETIGESQLASKSNDKDDLPF